MLSKRETMLAAKGEAMLFHIFGGGGRSESVAGYLVYGDGRVEKERWVLPRTYSKVYEQSCVADGDAWLETLRSARASEMPWNDSKFMPGAQSLGSKQWDSHHQSRWQRISKLFKTEAFIVLDFWESSGVGPEWAGKCGSFAWEFTEQWKSERFVANDDSAARSHAGYKETAMQFVDMAFAAEPIQHLMGQGVSEAKFIDAFAALRRHFEEQGQHVAGFGDVRIVVDTSLGPLEARIQVVLQTFFEDDVRLFDAGGRADVRQGLLADCYLLGALSALATRGDLLRDVFPTVPTELTTVLPREDGEDAEEEGGNAQEYNAEGVYAVRFWRDGAWHTVVLDDWVPCYDALDEHPHGPTLFASPPAGRQIEIWSLLTEKAYAKLNGSYANLVDGFPSLALQDFTGGAPFKWDMGPETTSEDGRFDRHGAFIGDHGGEERLWQALTKLCDEDAPMVVTHFRASGGSSSSDDLRFSGLLHAHSYSIVKTYIVDVEAAGGSRGSMPVRFVRLRNPWGEGGEFTGEWSARDPRWHGVASVDRTRCGLEEGADSFLMELRDFYETWEVFEACRTLRGWQRIEITSEWSGRWLAFPDISACPQFLLTPSAPCEIVVVIDLPARRPSGQTDVDYDTHVGLVVLRGIALPERRASVSATGMPGSDVRSKTGEELQCWGTGLRSSSWSIEVEPSLGPFIVCPITSTDFMSRFFMRVFCSKPCTLRPL